MSLRSRLALGVAVLTAILLTLGGYAFLTIFRANLVDSLDSGLTRRAGIVAERAGFPSGIAAVSPASPQASSGAPRTGSATPPPGELAEIVSPTGEVLGLSGRVEFRPTRAEERSVESGPLFLDSRVSGSPGPFRLLVERPMAGESWLVVVGRELTRTNDAVGHARNDLLLASGPLILGAGLLAFLVAVAALRPVEAIRRQIEAISSQDLAARLRIPRTHDEIAALGETMDRLLGRLQRALSDQRRLVSDAGHELRTPLAVLQAELELASQPGRSHDELVEAVGAAAEETGRVARLAEGLLLLAEIDEGHLAVRLEPTSLRELGAASLEAFRPRAETQGVHLGLDAGEGSLVVDIDPFRMRQVLDNLLDNALAVSPRGSGITLSITSSRSLVEVEVRDEGPGFAEDFLPHAFERFTRPDDARSRAGGGAGLGLAIVQAIAEAHGGHAEAGNAAGNGAFVRLEIPGGVAIG